MVVNGRPCFESGTEIAPSIHSTKLGKLLPRFFLAMHFWTGVGLVSPSSTSRRFNMAQSEGGTQIDVVNFDTNNNALVSSRSLASYTHTFIRYYDFSLVWIREWDDYEQNCICLSYTSSANTKYMETALIGASMLIIQATNNSSGTHQTVASSHSHSISYVFALSNCTPSARTIYYLPY